MSLLAVALVSFSAQPRAHAGNDDETLYGADAAMAGGAVTATERTSAALMYNPAGLAEVVEDTIDATVSALTWRRTSASNLLQSERGRHDPATLSEFLVVPAALAYVRPVGERVRVAVGLFQIRATDFTLPSSLRIPQDDGRVQDFQLAVSLAGNDYDGTLGVGWAALENLSFGAALHTVYISQSASLHFAGSVHEPDVVEPAAFASESVITRASIWGWRAGVGMQWQMHPLLRLGVAVLAPTLLITANRTLSHFVNAAGIPSLGDPSGVSVNEQYDLTHRGFDLVLPSRVRAGLAFEFDGGWLAIDGDYQHSVSTPVIGVSRKAVYNARLGGELLLRKHVRLGAGLFTDRGADLELRGFGDRSVDFYGGTFGIHFGTSHALAELEKDDAIHFDTTVALRYAYGNGQIAGLRIAEDLTEPDAVIQSPSVDMRISELSLYIASTLMF